MKLGLLKLLRILILVSAGVFITACSTVKTADNKPDVILISIDEMSCMEIQEYAHHLTGDKKRRMFYETPNLDRLCKEGLSFEKACSGSLYSPDKAGMLTGRVNGPDKSDGISRTISIAQALPDYDSTFIGEWRAEGSPEQMGFQASVKQSAPAENSINGITDKALSFIQKNSSNRMRPYFLCLNYSAEQGMCSVDKKSLRHFDNKRARGWNGMSDSRRAAMIKKLDDGIGEILHKLWRNGLEKRTAIIFMPSSSSDRKTDMGSTLITEAGACVPLVIRWKGHVKPASWSRIPVDYADILPTVMHCAGYFPDALNADDTIHGCSLSGLFWDARNQWQTYERLELVRREPGA